MHPHRGTTTVALPEHGQLVGAITEWQFYPLGICGIFHHTITTTMESLRLLHVARPSCLSFLKGPARLAAGVVLQTAGGETQLVCAVQGA